MSKNLITNVEMGLENLWPRPSGKETRLIYVGFLMSPEQKEEYTTPCERGEICFIHCLWRVELASILCMQILLKKTKKVLHIDPTDNLPVRRCKHINNDFF